MLAAGNDGVNLDTTDALYVPAMCDGVEIRKDDLNDELFEDSVFFARVGAFERAQNLVVQIAHNQPAPALNDNLIALNRTILFAQYAAQAFKSGDTAAAEQWLTQAADFNREFLDIEQVRTHFSS